MARTRLRPKKDKNKLRRKCDNCEMRFHSHFCLFLHLTVHSKVKAGWFQCGRCGKRFERLVNYIKHRSRHGNGRRQSKKLDETELADLDHGADESVEGKGDMPSFQVMKEDVHSEHGEFPCDKNTVINPELKVKEEEAKRNAFAIKFLEQLKDLLKLNEDTNEQIQEDQTESLQFSEVTSSNIPHDGFLSPSLSSPLSENAQEWQGNTQDQNVQNVSECDGMDFEIENGVVKADMDCDPVDNEIDCDYNATLEGSKRDCEEKNDAASTINNTETGRIRMSPESGMDQEPESNQILTMGKTDCEKGQSDISPENKMDREPENVQCIPENDCRRENGPVSAMNRSDCVTEQTKISQENMNKCDPINQISGDNQMDCGTENSETLAESDAHSVIDNVPESEDYNLCMLTPDGRMSPDPCASVYVKVEEVEAGNKSIRASKTNEGMENIAASSSTNSTKIKKEMDNSRCSKSHRSKSSSLVSAKRGSFTCFLCNARFSGYALLYKHKKTEHQITKTKSVKGGSNAILSCLVCKMTFATYWGLYSHRKSAHKVKSSQSPSNQLSQNKQKVDDKKVASVKVQRVSANNLSQNKLKIKELKLTSIKKKKTASRKLQPEKQKADMQSQVDHPYQCRFCLEGFTSFNGLSQHMRKIHKCYRKLDKDKNLFKRENVGPDYDSGNELFKQDAIDLAANNLGSTSFGTPGDASLLACTLCRSTFFTYGGLKGHLRTKHNVGVAVKPKDSEPKNEGDTNDANSAIKGESSVQINNGPERAREADIKTRSTYSKSSTCRKEEGDGYISDNNKVCKKCDKSFGSVKGRRQHALKSHGLEVSFEGEKFVFVEYNFVVNANTSQDAVKRGVCHTNSATSCPSQIFKCNICSAEYTKWNSYQKHMSTKHHIRKRVIDRNMMSVTSTHTVSKSTSDSIRFQEALAESGRTSTAAKNDAFRDTTGVACSTFVGTDNSKVRSSSAKLSKEDKRCSNGKQPNLLPECASVSSRPENEESPSILLNSESNKFASKEDDKIKKSLWRTDLARKKFDCFICGSSFAGFRVQRMHMLEYHNINLDKNGKRIKPVGTKRKGIDTSFDKYRKKMFASFNDEVVSNGEESSSEESKDVDSGTSDTEDGASSLTEQTSNSAYACADKNSKGKYLCPQCPMDFVTLIDRHIHMKDTHRKIQDLRRRTHERAFEMNLKAFPESKNIADSEYASRESTPISSNFGSDEDEVVAASFQEDTVKSSNATKQHEVAEFKTEANAKEANQTIQKAVKSGNDGQLKPYVCGYCDKAHSTCSSLMQHFKDAHHMRPKDSAERNKYTSQQPSLYHEREKPFVCGICNARMSVRKSIHQHLRKKHNILSQNNRARKSVTPLKKAPQDENRCEDNVRSSLLAISIDEAEQETVRNQLCEDPMVLSTDTEDEKMNGKFSPVPPGSDTEDDDQCYDNIDNTLRNLFDLALIDCSSNPGVSTVTRPPVSEGDSNSQGAFNTALDFKSSAESTAPFVEEHDGLNEDSFSRDEGIPDLIVIDVNSVKQEFPVDHARNGPHNSNTTARNIQLREEIVVIDSSEDEGEEVNVVDTDNDLSSMPSLISIDQMQDAAEDAQQDVVEIQSEDKKEMTMYQCSVCKIELASSQQLQLHKIRMSHHSGFVCKIAGCGKEFSSNRSYNDHIRNRCSLCHKRLSSAQKVKRHIREVHKIKDPLTCDICGQEFVEPISLAYHNREQHMTEQVS